MILIKKFSYPKSSIGWGYIKNFKGRWGHIEAGAILKTLFFTYF